jgi:DNA primase
MSGLQTRKAQIDLRDLVEADLGPARRRGGTARLWKCPFHQERRGYSLAVWPRHWHCFGACHMHGDALDWLQKYRGLSFREACAYLGAEHRPEHAARFARQRMIVTPEAQPPAERWQSAARLFAAWTRLILWREEGRRARAYLHRRGLRDETIYRANLGYLPGRPWEWQRLFGLSIPCGIIIPWFVGEELWAVKVRRAAGLPKYTQVAGGSAHGLYNAAALEDHETVLLVEGEFDALLAEQECGGLVGVATLGSASGTLNPHWLPLLLHCKTILVAYDRDEAGRKAAARLEAMTRRARVIQVPWGKDITEFVLQGGSIQQWLNANL